MNSGQKTGRRDINSPRMSLFPLVYVMFSGSVKFIRDPRKLQKLRIRIASISDHLVLVHSVTFAHIRILISFPRLMSSLQEPEKGDPRDPPSSACSLSTLKNN